MSGTVNRCECPLAGFCKRHGVNKTPREHELCATSAKYWNAWEAGKMPGQAGPPADPQPIVPSRTGGPSRQAKSKPSAPDNGRPGSELAAILHDKFGIAELKGCSCKSHAAQMDAWGVEGCKRELDTIVGWVIDEAKRREIPLSGTKAAEIAARQLVKWAIRRAEKAISQGVPFVPLDNPKRHLLMHIWPMANGGAWQWNCDQLLRHADQFNGRRIISIARGGKGRFDGKADPPEAVMDYLSDFTDEFIVKRNNRKLGEVINFAEMLSRVETTEPNEITMYCHAKGVRHEALASRQVDGQFEVDLDHPEHTIFRWTSAMYETLLDQPGDVARILQRNAITGTFRRRYGIPTTYGWHYSGTFYWFRNADVFRRNWGRPRRKYFGTESWPGDLFTIEQSHAIVDGVHHLYDPDHWANDIEPQLELWRQQFEKELSHESSV